MTLALNRKVSHLEKPYMSLFLVLLFYLTFIIKFEATFNNFYEKSEKSQNFTVFLPLGNFFFKISHKATHIHPHVIASNNSSMHITSNKIGVRNQSNQHQYEIFVGAKSLKWTQMSPFQK